MQLLRLGNLLHWFWPVRGQNDHRDITNVMVLSNEINTKYCSPKLEIYFRSKTWATDFGQLPRRFLIPTIPANLPSQDIPTDISNSLNRHHWKITHQAQAHLQRPSTNPRALGIREWLYNSSILSGNHTNKNKENPSTFHIKSIKSSSLPWTRRSHHWLMFFSNVIQNYSKLK